MATPIVEAHGTWATSFYSGGDVADPIHLRLIPSKWRTAPEFAIYGVIESTLDPDEHPEVEGVLYRALGSSVDDVRAKLLRFVEDAHAVDATLENAGGAA